jgi:hypothetical protein
VKVQILVTLAFDAFFPNDKAFLQKHSYMDSITWREFQLLLGDPDQKEEYEARVAEITSGLLSADVSADLRECVVAAMAFHKPTIIRIIAGHHNASPH